MSYDEIRRRYEEERDVAKVRKTAEMQSVLQGLRKKAIHKITIEYDGHNDEGFVKRITFVTSDGKQIDNDIRTSDSTSDSPIPAIEEFVFALLPGGWETNEGSFGTCIIDVATGAYDLKHIWGPGKPHYQG